MKYRNAYHEWLMDLSMEAFATHIMDRFEELERQVVLAFVIGLLGGVVIALALVTVLS